MNIVAEMSLYPLKEGPIPTIISFIKALREQGGEDIVVVASKGGMPQHPDWYLNVAANPEV